METRPRATELIIELPIRELVGANFNLENAVCSHGLFMMAPNKWDRHSKTLERPLRLGDDNSPSVNVQISHPKETPNALQLHVFDVQFLSNHHQQSLMVTSQFDIIVFFIHAFKCCQVFVQSILLIYLQIFPKTPLFLINSTHSIIFSPNRTE